MPNPIWTLFDNNLPSLDLRHQIARWKRAFLRSVGEDWRHVRFIPTGSKSVGGRSRR
jgi:hypothetical protein